MTSFDRHSNAPIHGGAGVTLAVAADGASMRRPVLLAS